MNLENGLFERSPDDLGNAKVVYPFSLLLAFIYFQSSTEDGLEGYQKIKKYVLLKNYDSRRAWKDSCEEILIEKQINQELRSKESFHAVGSNNSFNAISNINFLTYEKITTCLE